MDDRDDQRWTEQARGGDRRAFEALVTRYWDRVYRWLYGLTRRGHLAEDLTQESFLRAWTNLPRLEGGACFRPWLFRIARNCLADHHRNPRSAPTVPVPEATASPQPGPEAEAVSREGQSLLEEACAALPAHFRAALLLWTQEELPYSEIAHVLGVTEETARWRVCRARQLLLRLLAAHHGDRS